MCGPKHLKKQWFLQQYFCSGTSSSSKPRYNALDIQMLSKHLHEQIFGGQTSDIDPSMIHKSIEHLSKHDLYGKQGTSLQDVNFQLPPLHGSTIEEHFINIAKEQTKNYLKMAQQISKVNLPCRPAEWSFEPGWTKYEQDGDIMYAVPVGYPVGDVMVFDVEVCVNEGQFPTMAVLATSDNWYSWVSHRLIEERSYQWFLQPNTQDLIPFETTIDSSLEDAASKERLVIGHSVGYDRSFLKEQYLIKGPQTYFLDTLSLHMCISGLTGLQRSLYKAASVDKADKEDWMETGSLNNLAAVYQFYCGGKELDKEKRNVFVHGTLDDVKEQFQELMTYCSNDVASTHEVFCQVWPIFLERFPHPVTFAGMLEMSTAYLPVDKTWEKYINDCEDTYEDLEKEMKSSLMRLADDACHLLHGNQYQNDLWLWDLDWSVQDVRIKKPKPPKKGRKKKQKEEEMNEQITEEDEEQNIIAKIPVAEDVLYKKRQHLPGYPSWYRKLCPRMDSEAWERGSVLVSAQCRVGPSLLRMTWDGFPLYYHRRHGWGYLVPGRSTNLESDEHQHFPRKAFQELWQRIQSETEQLENAYSVQEAEDAMELSEGDLWSRVEEKELKNKDGVSLSVKTSPRKRAKVAGGQDAPEFHHGVGPFNDVDLPGVWFFRIPHKDGEKFKCGNPLAKDYISKMEDETLKSDGDESAERTLLLNKMISFWRNAKHRVMSQLFVWLDKEQIPDHVINSFRYSDENQYGAILPRLITAGTVTRRAVEPTWLTASNPRPDRVGSELKAMIRAPPGYSFVGADVDSQELWIAALLGDAYFAKTHGCTAFGWMTLQGKRGEGTDLHSKTADTIGISREHAKIFNYGRIYGAGISFAEKLLLQFNHRLTETEARTKAEKLYSSTKGIQRHRLSEYGLEVAKKYKYNDVITEGGFLDSKNYYQLLKASRRYRDSGRAISLYKEWQDGSESQMFNKLESIAQSDEPETPVLGGKISRALEPNIVGNKFITSRINWVVQSSAVDYLHLMLVSMKWLFSECKIDGRFCISIHDEVRYLVNSEDRYRAALALQITNLLTRSLFAYKLGMNDLPQSVAFFSAVDIDLIIRKEVTMDCKTPSNPRGFARIHGIEEGEALDIYDILRLTNNGSLEKRKEDLEKNDLSV